MLVSKINDLVKALNDNKKNGDFDPSSHRRWAIRLGHPRNTLCRFSEILLSSGYRRDKADTMRSGPPPSWAVEVRGDNQDAYPALATAVPYYAGHHLNQFPEFNPFETYWTFCSNKFGYVWLNVELLCCFVYVSVSLLSRLSHVMLFEIRLGTRRTPQLAATRLLKSSRRSSVRHLQLVNSRRIRAVVVEGSERRAGAESTAAQNCWIWPATDFTHGHTRQGARVFCWVTDSRTSERSLDRPAVWRPQTTIDHALVDMLHHWHVAVNKGESVRTIFVDFAKAFDHVDHTCWSPSLLLWVCLTSSCGGWPPFYKSDDSAWRSATSCQTGCSCQLACHRDHTSAHWRLSSWSTRCNRAVWHINTWTTRRWQNS